MQGLDAGRIVVQDDIDPPGGLDWAGYMMVFGMPNDWSLIHGRREEPPSLPSLRSGHLTASLARGEVIGLEHRGRELVQVIGARVRDPAWGTIPGGFDELQVERGTGTTVARTHARYRGADIDVSCAISILIGSDTLDYELDGVAESAFDYARIGIVVLHPSGLTAGRRFRALGRRGSTEGVLPTLVGPQLITDGETKPLFAAFEHLEIDVEPGLTLAFELQGDEFEMEDQRNWTDGSFKTYSTPVGLPLPHRARSGDRFHQRLRVEIRETRSCAPARAAGRPGVVVGSAPGPGAADRTMPPLGTTWRPRPAGTAQSPAALGPGFLRVKLDDEAELAGDVRAASAVAAAAGAELELAVHLPRADTAARRWLSALEEVVARDDCPPVRLTPTREGEPVTTPETVRLVRDRLPRAAILAGSAENFAELNRCPPPDGTPVDGLFFAANPQMHDTDDRLVMLSLDGQRDAARTARTLTGGLPVHVSPVTLLPATAPHADARQRSLFTAAWLAGSAAALTAAGIASASWFQLTGARGLVSEDDGEPSPAFHALRELCSWRGRRLVTVTASDPHSCAGLATQHDGELRMLLANLTPGALAFDVGGLGSQARVAVLDAVTAGEAEPFTVSERPMAAGGSAGRVELGPYAVARIRASPGDAG